MDVYDSVIARLTQEKIVAAANAAHAKTMAGPDYIPLRKHWIEEVMTTQEDFNKAWANYTHVPNDPKDRLRDLVKERLGIDIMYTQAMRVLEEGFAHPANFTNWDKIKEEVATMTDDEVIGLFYEFVKKHKGE